MAIEGSASIDIDAPIDRVYAIAADVEGSPRWQPEIKKALVTERGPGGEQTFVKTEVDGKVRTLKSDLRFSFAGPTGLSWDQEHGDLKAVRGSWEFEDLGGGRTKATYNLYVDFGRTLGLVIRGPLVGILRGQLCDSMPAKLKGFVEAEGA
ncbi:MAG: cyclase/dehydrase [Solirubrobacterales bacterium]|nr:cyclase/dehydrase [Solirubrobacterales bacterium]